MSWVSERRDHLRNELLLQTGLFLPLTDHEYEALKLSIGEYGVQTPVLLGTHIPLIDGRHRLLITKELGMDCPAILVHDLGPEAERQLAISLNSARRQITRAQKRAIVDAELMRDPARSDRLIAAIAGVHWDTVGEARRAITAAQALRDSPPSEPDTRPNAEQQLEDLGIVHRSSEPPAPATEPKRRGRDGILRPPSQPARPITNRPPKEIGTAACEHGLIHKILQHHDGHLELIHA